jgi:hypothetical protein
MSSQASEQDAGYPVKLTTRQWREGDADFVNTGIGVREAGWGPASLDLGSKQT